MRAHLLLTWATSLGLVLPALACQSALEGLKVLTRPDPTPAVSSQDGNRTSPTHPPRFSDLSAGWTKIEPGGRTRCALDTPYAYWVRPGSPDNLLVYFQGGGGCWSAETCSAGSPLYDGTVSAFDSPEINPGGILNLDHPENPFRDYSVVFIPVCTGDVHWGSNVRTYPRQDGGELQVHHMGFINASSAMDWVFASFESPERIFVTGCSAGSVGSILFSAYFIEHCPDSQVTQLGASLSFTFHRPLNLQEDYGAHDNFPDWIPALSRIHPGEFKMSEFYSAIANYYPETRFSQFNTVHDRVQERYYLAIGGVPGGFAPAQEANLAEIHDRADNFRSFTAAGDLHCILPRASFYRLETGGMLIRDWVADLAAGRQVDNVRCRDC